MLLLSPVLPSLADRVRAFMNLPSLAWSALDAPLPAGHRINAYQHLMTRVDPKQLDALFEPPAAAVAVAPAAAPRPAPAAAPVARADEGVIGIDAFAQVDLRIARIVSAELVEGSDKLLRLRLDLGEGGERTVFSGIRKWYSPEQLTGRLTVMVANLAPRKMKFGVSEGMVLAASFPDDGGGVFLLDPHAGAQPGMKVR